MKSIYLIRKKQNGQYLNQKNEWSNNILSYRLKEFETEEEAKAAFPEGISCVVTKSSKKEAADGYVSNIKYKYYLQDLQSKCFLNSSDQFKVWAAIMPEAFSFDSEDAALDKAEDMNLNLDSIRVIRLIFNDKKKES
jgi:hypothetical protein